MLEEIKYRMGRSGCTDLPGTEKSGGEMGQKYNQLSIYSGAIEFQGSTLKSTIGCAKKRLVGEFSEVGRQRGDYSKLFYKGREAGAVVRTRTGVKPLFISPGYALTIKDAIRMVLNCGGRYRIPEPIRMAHMLVNQLRKREEGKND
jgi:hypothetical protein